MGGSSLSIDNSINSSEQLLSGLNEEFKKLKYVNVESIKLTATIGKNYIDFFKNLPNYDFVLINFYSSFSIIKNINLIKNKIKYKVCSFIEHPQQDMDYTFGFLKKLKPDCYIKYPYSKKFMFNKIKNKKTILLDNMLNNDYDISKNLSKYLFELLDDGYEFYQLTKDKTCADFIKPLFMCKYKEYMQKTELFETFIQTHPGSYEHSIIDMLARGVRVIVPRNMNGFNRYFIPEETIEYFNIPSFSNKKELLDIIRENPNTNYLNKCIDNMTEMKDVVKIIDEYFQSVIF